MNARAKETLFSSLNEQLQILDASIGDNIRCPLCWNLFGPSALQSELSVEHVSPTATAKLIKESQLTTLTCNQCNHNYGSQYHSHLKKFLVFQLHQAGKYDKPIPGTIVPSERDLVPLKSNIIFTPKDIKVIGVPKANAVSTTQSHVSTWDLLSKSNANGWSFTVEFDYGCILSAAWLAYLQVAYLMVYVLTECHYAFTKAGVEIRNGLIQGNIKEIGPCVITPNKIGVGGKPWIAKIVEPANLRCLWVKIAGNIVIMPFPDDDKLSCYKEWQKISDQTHFGLRPHKTHLKITFHSREDALAAQQCIVLSPD